MRRYRISFIGRPIGSLSALAEHQVSRIVSAESAFEAKTLAYEKHEHIKFGLDGVSVKELPTEEGSK